ncbi:KpsF/GutQ family sugar-phosphate isomerase [Primorskyibacter aestuariivivens]|uniref:KpsF/GutQ family sugar-phosphate isomerase n=1 Tax=Primorskyibacter aestuariivivens TaxID=1888912 RepID=UPI0023002F36|nr:KpsF/GutQ family sugar-phosphate isomerase [Primorskyibacter aestuariivivens]MDA7429275.1 KpsF/GutQ family sugar-phosphate isomerase [Primorskyibacter aestuariivivens]
MTDAQGEIDQTACRVLRTEAEALTTLAGNLPADFERSVRLLAGVEGRVIISGIGKSGHIGRKISATLASTGTPSYFVHGAEASHGDLGMITRHDVCLLISNSGETLELRDILLHCKRFSIPLIGISSNPDSTLMKAADYRLTLPKLPEACPMGLAPTTSTTLTLALGDALAVAVMELRGFKSEDFQVFHPGGKLGAQLSRVEDLMHGGEELPLVPSDMAMGDALLTMTSKGFGIAAVVQDGKLVGVVSDGDLRRNMGRLMEMTAGEMASRNPVTVTPDILAAEALAILNERKIGALMVVDAENCPVGVVHIHDVLRAGVA